VLDPTLLQQVSKVQLEEVEVVEVADDESLSLKRD